MLVVYHVSDDISSKEKTKHVIKFFGILGFIKANVLGEKVFEKAEDKSNIVEKEVSEEAEGKLNIFEYHFDYPHFSAIVNPEHFQKELDDREKKFTRRIATLWLCSATLFMVFAGLLYLAYKNQKSIKILTALAVPLLTLFTLASIFFVAGLLWIFLDFIKEKLVIHRIENHLKDLDPKLVKKYKNALLGKKLEKNDEAHDEESEKNKDIEDITQFLLERKKILALFKFLTNGEKLVQAGMAMVDKLLRDGVHPNDIVLDTNSLGGGIAAEVLRRFEEQGIYLTLIHSNSYSSLKDATNNFPHGIGNFFTKRLPAKLLNFWFTYCGLDFNPEEVIKKTKCPVLIVGRKGDLTIPESAQLANKLKDSTNNTFIFTAELIHNPNINCNNTENPHIDYEEHFVCEWDKNGKTEYISYEEMKRQFIEKASEYLREHELNDGFNLKGYEESEFSQDLNEKFDLKEHRNDSSQNVTKVKSQQVFNVSCQQRAAT